MPFAMSAARTLPFGGLSRDIDGLFTVVAEFSGQTLRNDEAHRRGDRIGLDSHVDQSSERLRSIIGMQCRENQVAGLGRLDGDFGGFQISDFTDHDDIRILAQECSKRRRKGQSHLVVDVDLIDAGQVDFGRIFGRRDIAVLVLRIFRPV